MMEKRGQCYAQAALVAGKDTRCSVNTRLDNPRASLEAVAKRKIRAHAEDEVIKSIIHNHELRNYIHVSENCEMLSDLHIL
jgi:hypothetical protein